MLLAAVSGWLRTRGVARNFSFWGEGYKFSKLIIELFWGGIIMYIIRSITIKMSFLLHKNIAGLILGGYMYRYPPPRHYGPAKNIPMYLHIVY